MLAVTSDIMHMLADTLPMIGLGLSGMATTVLLLTMTWKLWKSDLL